MSLYYFLKDIVKLKFNYNLGKKTWFGTGGKSSIFLVINTNFFNWGWIKHYN
jgi:hypothetical protein